MKNLLVMKLADKSLILHNQMLMKQKTLKKQSLNLLIKKRLILIRKKQILHEIGVAGKLQQVDGIHLKLMAKI